jgi:hypothetical protein
MVPNSLASRAVSAGVGSCARRGGLETLSQAPAIIVEHKQNDNGEKTVGDLVETTYRASVAT